jgi:hypothetical protein
MLLSVAGIRVRLDVADEPLAAAVRARYGAFTTGAAAPDFDWRIAVRDRRHSLEAEPVVEHTGELRYALSYGAVEGELDLAAGTGALRLPGDVLYLDAALRIALTLLLAERGGLLLHACGFVRGPRAFVLFGPSGAGKTTVARMVPPADVLSDEVVAVVPAGAGLTAHGTPFYGDLGVSNPRSAPVAALARLRHGPDALEPLSTGAAASALLNSALFFCHSPQVTEKVVGAATRIGQQGVRLLTFRKETHVPAWLDAALAA